MKKNNVLILGATGLVGEAFLEYLEKYNFPVNRLTLYASCKSEGKIISFLGKEYLVKEINEDAFNDVDVAFFSAGADVSLKWAPVAESKGVLVIDNSSAFRMRDDCSLIVPEINLDDYKNKRKIIANPNCTTIQTVIPLNVLKKYGIKRIIYNTYQAVSGSGAIGISDLKNTIKGNSPTFYPYNISRTCIPHIDNFLDNGYTIEEFKMIEETKKILHLPDTSITATCVRVPVILGHAVCVLVELLNEFDLDIIKKELSEHEEIIILDDIKNNIYPTSIAASGSDKVYVGRLRRDYSSPNALLFYCVADNIRRGAAANAIMIAKKILE